MTGEDTESSPHIDHQPGRTADEHAGGIDHQMARQGARLLLEAIGADPDSDAFEATWRHRIPATLETLTEGRRPEAKPALTTFAAESDGLVVKTGIPVYSLCEHHLLPYSGTAHVAYRPNGRVVGLSKLVRYVRWRARDLTLQEQLTTDIATGLADELGVETVLVELEATHLCEAMRGVETASVTTTRASVGEPTAAERRQFRDAIAAERDGR